MLQILSRVTIAMDIIWSPRRGRESPRTAAKPHVGSNAGDMMSVLQKHLPLILRDRFYPFPVLIRDHKIGNRRKIHTQMQIVALGGPRAQKGIR